MYLVLSAFTSSPVSLLATTTASVGIAVAQWLRCCATNRKVAGSIPDGVMGIFVLCDVL